MKCDFNGQEYPDSDVFHTFGDYTIHDSNRESFLEEHAQCDDSGEWFPKDELTKVIRENGEIGHVYDEDDYWECEDEDVPVYYTLTTEVNYRTSSGRTDTRFYYRIERAGCSKCRGTDEWWEDECGTTIGRYWYSFAYLEDSERFYRCECCVNWFDTREEGGFCEAADGWRCNDCWEEEEEEEEDSSSIMSYGQAKRCGFTPIGEGPLWFGVEIEVLCDSESESRREKAQSIIDELPQPVYICEDGSVGGSGFEIISQPMSLELHRKLWDGAEWKRLRSGLNGDNSKCGLHVHVSRAPLTDLQIGKILVMIGEPTHKSYVEAIARRTSEQYAKIHKKKLADCRSTSVNRYEAVNITNKETIEFRIFKGNTRPDRILAALEFCDAMIKFCAPAETGIRQLTWRNWLEFCVGLRKSHKYLWGRLIELNWVDGKKAKVLIEGPKELALPIPDRCWSLPKTGWSVIERDGFVEVPAVLGARVKVGSPLVDRTLNAVDTYPSPRTMRSIKIELRDGFLIMRPSDDLTADVWIAETIPMWVPFHTLDIITYRLNIYAGPPTVDEFIQYLSDYGYLDGEEIAKLRELNPVQI